MYISKLLILLEFLKTYNLLISLDFLVKKSENNWIIFSK